MAPCVGWTHSELGALGPHCDVLGSPGPLDCFIQNTHKVKERCAARAGQSMWEIRSQARWRYAVPCHAMLYALTFFIHWTTIFLDISCMPCSVLGAECLGLKQTDTVSMTGKCPIS